MLGWMRKEEQLRVDRLELLHHINLTLIVYGLALLLVQYVWPDVNFLEGFFRFYALTAVACWYIRRVLWKLPSASTSNEQARSQSSSPE